MLKKHRRVFAGPEGRLGKVDARFNMSIEADTKAIKSQQPYRTSPRKRKLIKKAVYYCNSRDQCSTSSSNSALPPQKQLLRQHLLQHQRCLIQSMYCIPTHFLRTVLALHSTLLPKPVSSKYSVYHGTILPLSPGILDTNDCKIS